MRELDEDIFRTARSRVDLSRPSGAPMTTTTIADRSGSS